MEHMVLLFEVRSVLIQMMKKRKLAEEGMRMWGLLQPFDAVPPSISSKY